MTSPKVVFITENHTFGGGNRYVEDLINSFSVVFPETYLICNKGGFRFFNLDRLKKKLSATDEVSIFNLSEKIRRLSRWQRALLKIALLPFFIFLNTLSLFSLRKKINLLAPDLVVLANGGYPASLYLVFYAAFFAPKNIPFIMSIVGTPTRKKTNLSAWFWQMVDRRVARNLKYAIANTHNIKSILSTHFYFPAEKIQIIQNGLEFLPAPVHENKPAKSVTIGFLSRLEKDKGIYELLEAFKLLVKTYPHLHLTLVGAGAELENVRKIAENESRISVHGYVSHTAPFYTEFDIYALPSYHEGLPYSLIEACRAGCAIVATSVGGIPEVIQNNVSGLLVRPQNAQELASALEKFVVSYDLRQRHGSEARKVFEQHLSLESMDDKVLAISSAILARRSI